MRKGLIRDLDVIDDSGRALPILTRDENALISAAALYVLVNASRPGSSGTETSAATITPLALWQRVWNIAVLDSDVAAKEAEKLIRDLDLNETVQAAILDLASNFLLCALLPITNAQTRQVLKFSYHWEGASGFSPIYYLRLSLAGLGYCSTRMLVEAPGSETANSYHLEVPAPRGLLVTDISSAQTPQASWPRPHPRPVGHFHASDDLAGSSTAAVYLRLAGPGLLTTMFMYLLIASALLSAMRFYPDALINAAANTDAVTALVALAPALLFGLATRGSESAVVSRMLLPLRTIAGLLSAYFLGLSALLIFDGVEAVAIYVKIGLTATIFLAVILGTGRTLTWLSSHTTKDPDLKRGS